MLAEFSVTPVGRGESLSDVVAACVEIVRRSGLPYELHAMGTILEGDYDEAMAVIRACHREARHRANRVTTLIKIDDRGGPKGRGMLRRKVESVEARLKGERRRLNQGRKRDRKGVGAGV